MNGVSMTDKALYDSWSKLQIYEAYLSENETRQALNRELNRVYRLLAEIKHKAGGSVD